MILESRSIIFSDEELFVALRPIVESRGLNADLPIKTISARLNDEGEVAATIEMTDGTDPIVIEGRNWGRLCSTTVSTKAFPCHVAPTKNWRSAAIMSP